MPVRIEKDGSFGVMGVSQGRTFRGKGDPIVAPDRDTKPKRKREAIRHAKARHDLDRHRHGVGMGGL